MVKKYKKGYNKYSMMNSVPFLSTAYPIIELEAFHPTPKTSDLLFLRFNLNKYNTGKMECLTTYKMFNYEVWK